MRTDQLNRADGFDVHLVCFEKLFDSAFVAVASDDMHVAMRRNHGGEVGVHLWRCMAHTSTTSEHTSKYEDTNNVQTGILEPVSNQPTKGSKHRRNVKENGNERERERERERARVCVKESERERERERERARARVCVKESESERRENRERERETRRP